MAGAALVPAKTSEALGYGACAFGGLFLFSPLLLAGVASSSYRPASSSLSLVGCHVLSGLNSVISFTLFSESGPRSFS